MLQFDVEKTLRETATIQQVRDYVLLKMGDNKYGRHWEEKIRKVMSLKEFTIPVSVLDIMCRLIDAFGHYTSWSEFERLQGKNEDAIYSEQFRTKSYHDLTIDEKQLIRSFVERRLGVLYERFRYQNIPPETERKRVIKAATEEEVKLIAGLAERVYPCRINGSDIKISWHRKNKNIFYACFDQHGELIANLNLIPLRKEFYQHLKHGQLYEDQITADDIFSLEEKDKVSCIYIEGFASLSRSILAEYRKGFANMVAKLANPDNSELIICAIGGSAQGDRLLRKYQFTKTGTAYDDVHNQRYDFLETRWRDLHAVIKRKIADAETLHSY
jgi:hypothetical protein